MVASLAATAKLCFVRAVYPERRDRSSEAIILIDDVRMEITKENYLCHHVRVAKKQPAHKCRNHI